MDSFRPHAAGQNQTLPSRPSAIARAFFRKIAGAMRRASDRMPHHFNLAQIPSEKAGAR
ncbi:hypothetical protein RHEC894_PE00623 (plasmid) [Rhizobium sp. CIAT894]|nr:hypothetical protein RHEC894_PE00623 [Rhizobium sp. CIAT894]